MASAEPAVTQGSVAPRDVVGKDFFKMSKLASLSRRVVPEEEVVDVSEVGKSAGFGRCLAMDRNSYRDWVVTIVETKDGKKEVFGPPPPVSDSTPAVVRCASSRALLQLDPLFSSCSSTSEWRRL